MAYRIKIKHNIEGVSMDLHLKYDSDDNFQDIPITLTNQLKTIQLRGWNPQDEVLDISKIKIRETQYVVNDKIYVFESTNFNIAQDEYQDDYDLIEEIVGEKPNIDESTQSNQEQIIDKYNKTYNTGSYNTQIGELICSDTSKYLYDHTIDMHNSYPQNVSKTEDEMTQKYGEQMLGGFLSHKSASGYKGRVSYDSIYFGPVLLEANSQYARIKLYDKTGGFFSQSVNEEGRKNGSKSYGYVKKNNRLLPIEIMLPNRTDTVYNLYTGPDANAEILSITFVPDYSEASTSYKPCKGNIYINGTKVLENDTFIRVRLQKGVQYVISADNISFMGKTDWQTLGNHYVTMPLYTDNILKIVVFNENANHGYYTNLYNQARTNNWGLPNSLFTSN